MTTPTIVPINRSGTYKDFLQTKVDRSGAARAEAFSVSVPSGTVTTTVVGLVPFNRGFRFDVGATQLAVAALGTSVTIDVGYVYDDNVSFTNDPDAFASGLTVAAAGGLIVFDEVVGLRDFVAEGNGWVVVTIGGATTGTTGSIFGQVNAVYDGLQAASNR